MFESLSDKLSGILNALTRRGALSEEDVNLALREVRRALIEADVALDVVRSFTDKVRERAVGAEVVRSVSPGHVPPSPACHNRARNQRRDLGRPNCGSAEYRPHWDAGHRQ